MAYMRDGMTSGSGVGWFGKEDCTVLVIKSPGVEVGLRFDFPDEREPRRFSALELILEDQIKKKTENESFGTFSPLYSID
jgi:hypothetical protein